MRCARVLAAICIDPPHGTPIHHPCCYDPIAHHAPAARRKVPGCSRGCRRGGGDTSGRQMGASAECMLAHNT
eukprot:7349317-Prymnesium_polylepis.1